MVEQRVQQVETRLNDLEGRWQSHCKKVETHLQGVEVQVQERLHQLDSQTRQGIPSKDATFQSEPALVSELEARFKAQVEKVLQSFNQALASSWGGCAGTASSIDPTRRDWMGEGVRGVDGVRGD